MPIEKPDCAAGAHRQWAFLARRTRFSHYILQSVTELETCALYSSSSRPRRWDLFFSYRFTVLLSRYIVNFFNANFRRKLPAANNGNEAAGFTGGLMGSFLSLYVREPVLQKKNFNRERAVRPP